MRTRQSLVSFLRSVLRSVITLLDEGFRLPHTSCQCQPARLLRFMGLLSGPDPARRACPLCHDALAGRHHCRTQRTGCRIAQPFGRRARSRALHLGSIGQEAVATRGSVIAAIVRRGHVAGGADGGQAIALLALVLAIPVLCSSRAMGRLCGILADRPFRLPVSFAAAASTPFSTATLALLIATAVALLAAAALAVATLVVAIIRIAILPVGASALSTLSIVDGRHGIGFDRVGLSACRIMRAVGGRFVGFSGRFLGVVEGQGRQ